MSDSAPIIEFGDFRAFIIITLMPSWKLSTELIDRAARDAEIIISPEGGMYYRRHPVESFCGVPSVAVTPLILARRQQFAEQEP